MDGFKSRISMAAVQAKEKFQERIDFSKTLQGSDRGEGYQLQACILYPFDLVSGYFGAGKSSERTA